MMDIEVIHKPHPVSENAGSIVIMRGMTCINEVTYDAHPDGVFRCKSKRDAEIAVTYLMLGYRYGIAMAKGQIFTPSWPEVKISAPTPIEGEETK